MKYALAERRPCTLTLYKLCSFSKVSIFCPNRSARQRRPLKESRSRTADEGRPPHRPHSAGYSGRVGLRSHPPKAPHLLRYPSCPPTPPASTSPTSGPAPPQVLLATGPPTSGPRVASGSAHQRPPFKALFAGGSAHLGPTCLQFSGPGGVVGLKEDVPGLPASPSHLGLWFRFSAIQGTKRYL